ncbi:hypothetical protein GCM10018962_96790 [Dactylosporangium matsuzakiense]|uniref:Lipoprotein n=2 Tax=Dactylosporangium matsuzakiense TaxID=53360 RepID=A0A9W6KF21_9ACTN|nr:hypothetical protein GCM10017581_018630 [Dactylosporangium matsuzakiense]
MRRMAVPLLLSSLPVFALVSSLGGCGWASRHDETAKPDGFLLHGYVSVPGASAGVAGTACLAPPSAPDIHEGGNVRIADDQGRTIAAATLAGGVLASDGTGFDCNFAFELRNASGSRAAYQISVGGRPALTFTTKELAEGKPAVVPVADAVRASTSPS